MTQALEQRIRERAYDIWMSAGCESGLADLHWLSAEQAVMDEATHPAPKGVRSAKGSGSAKSPKSAKVAAVASAKPRAKSAVPATLTVRKRVKKDQVCQA